jgi:hypothetical protein
VRGCEVDKSDSLALPHETNATQLFFSRPNPPPKGRLPLRPPTPYSLNFAFVGHTTRVWMLPCTAVIVSDVTQCNAMQSSRDGDQLGGKMWLKLNMQSVYRCSIEAQKARRARSLCGKPFSSPAMSFGVVEPDALVSSVLVC